MNPRVVWKFPLTSPGLPLLMPAGADIIFVGQQDGVPTLWAIVTPENHVVARDFEVIGTGHEFDPATRRAHIGSVICGPFVWHVFERVA